MVKKGQKLQQYTGAFKQSMFEKYRSGILASVLSEEQGCQKIQYLRANASLITFPLPANEGIIDDKERYEIIKNSKTPSKNNE